MLKPLLQLLSMHMNTTACMCVHILIRIGLQPCYVREMSGLFFFPFGFHTLAVIVITRELKSILRLYSFGKSVIKVQCSLTNLLLTL